MAHSEYAHPSFEALEPRTLLSVVPTVSIEATTPAAAENGTNGVFTVTRSVVSASPLKVKVSVSGSAKNGTDYAKLGTTVTIPAGAASATVTISPVDDGKTEPAETVVLSLAKSSAYAIDALHHADTVTIADATYLAADFLPLVDGSRFDYKGVADGEYFHQTVEIAINGQYMDMNATSDDNAYWSAHTQTIQSDTNGLSLVGEEDDGGTTTYDPALLWTPPAMTIGATYTGNGTFTEDSGDGTYTTTIKALGVEVVTVPGGKFRCLKIQTTRTKTQTDSSITDTSTTWLARGLGIVKMSDQTTEIDSGHKTKHTYSIEMTTDSITSAWVAASAMSDARTQFAGGVIGDNIYAFGGYYDSGGEMLTSIEAYDTLADQWDDSLADNPHTYADVGAAGLSSAVVDGKLYVFGSWGYGNSGLQGTVNFAESYDPQTDTWTSLAPKPTTVSSAPCAVYNGQIYVFGGEYSYEKTNGTFKTTYPKVVEAYDPVANTWRKVTNMPKAVSHPGVAVIGTKAYLFGGYTSAGGLSSVTAYDFATNKWTTKGLASLPQARAFSTATACPVVDGKAYLIGGVTGDSKFSYGLTSVDVYDPVTNTYSSGPSLPMPLVDQLTVVANNTLYVIGGDRYPGDDDNALAQVLSLPLL